MLGNFDVVPPTPIQLRTTARLLGWRMGLDHVDPRGTVVLASAGSSFSKFPLGATPTLPTIFTHRDVGITDCPGNAAYAVMDQIRDIAARFNDPPGPADLAESLRGGAIFARWESMGGMTSPLGAPTSPEASGTGPARYATFERGRDLLVARRAGRSRSPARSIRRGARWASNAARSACRPAAKSKSRSGLCRTSQHGTLNFDREKGTVTRVIDGIPVELPNAIDR